MPTNPVDLQFETTEYTQPQTTGPTCSSCKQPLVAEYYDVGGNTVCPACKFAVESSLCGGSGFLRFMGAIAGGLIGAVIGASIYFAILKITGYEIGLIAIVVGLLVGGGVRWGCKARGGWLYQLLAIGLTYCAIVVTYVPMILREVDEVNHVDMKSIIDDYSEVAKITITLDSRVNLNANTATREEWREELNRLKSANGAVWYFEEGADLDLFSPIANEVRDEVKRLELPIAEFSDAEFTRLKIDPLIAPDDPIFKKIVLLAITFALALVSPFLSLPSNLIGLIIIGIALYEAWKINKKPQIAITGPYHLASVAVATPPALSQDQQP